MSKRQFLLTLIPFIALIVAGVLIYPRGGDSATLEASGDTDESIVFAMVGNDPLSVEEKLTQLTEFMNKFLAAENLKIVPFVASSLDQVESKLLTGEIEFYLDSPYPIYILNRDALVQPVARHWRDGIAEYHSIFLTRQTKENRSIDDLNGLRIAFEDSGSSSSFFLPAAELSMAGYQLIEAGGDSTPRDDPHIFYTFSNWDQYSYDWLLEEKVDVAAVNSVFYNSLDPKSRMNVRIIHESENIPRHILAARSGLDPRIEDAVVSLLLDMETSDEGREVLSNFYNTRRFDLIPYELDLREKMLMKLERLAWER